MIELGRDSKHRKDIVVTQFTPSRYIINNTLDRSQPSSHDVTSTNFDSIRNVQRTITEGFHCHLGPIFQPPLVYNGFITTYRSCAI